jgi:hypothetical protein
MASGTVDAMRFRLDPETGAMTQEMMASNQKGRRESAEQPGDDRQGGGGPRNT